MNDPIQWLQWTGLHLSPWKLVGLVGALMFAGRWVVQLVASRQHGMPVIPRMFWYMSLIGSGMTLSYFLFSQKQDSVGIVQNLFPAFTAGYSLWLDIRHRGWHRERAKLKRCAEMATQSRFRRRGRGRPTNNSMAARPN